MNRIEIKAKARELLKGRVWDVFLPFFIAGIISSALYAIFGGTGDNESYKSLSSFLISCALYPINFGCVVYVMKFVRKEPFDLKLIFTFYPKFIYIFGLYFLISLFSSLWALLLIVPGIIAALSYSMAPYLMADGNEDPMDCIRQSKEMMMGYKWDYCKFVLSFILWYLAIVATAGLAIIYVGPYVQISQILYYEELRKISKK